MDRTTWGWGKESEMTNQRPSFQLLTNGRKVSSVGPEFARTRSIIFLIFGLVVLGIAIGITGEKEITKEINIFMIFSFQLELHPSRRRKEECMWCTLEPFW